jgi:hypothetical protein
MASQIGVAPFSTQGALSAGSQATQRPSMRHWPPLGLVAHWASPPQLAHEKLAPLQIGVVDAAPHPALSAGSQGLQRPVAEMHWAPLALPLHCVSSAQAWHVNVCGLQYGVAEAASQPAPVLGLHALQRPATH